MKILVVFFLSLGLLVAPALASQPLIYQGEIKDGGEPLEGPYFMQFELYSSSSGGNPVDVSYGLVTFNNGLFQAELDFSSDSFDGGNRWLEVLIEDDSGDIQTLGPRQRVGASPIALFALEGNEGPQGPPGPEGPEGPPGSGEGGESVFSLSGSDAYYTQGSVGIGTSSPNATLHIRPTGDDFPLGVESGNGTALLVHPNNSVSIGGSSPPGDSGLNVTGKASFLADVFMGRGLSISEGLRVDDRVGIGTNSPSATTHIAAGGQDQVGLLVESSSGNEDLLVWNNGGVTIGGTSSTFGRGLTVDGHSILYDQVSIGGFEGPKDDVSLQVVGGHAAVGGFSHDYRLGVGTDNPWTPLHVVSNDDQDPFRAMVGSNSASQTSIHAYSHQGVAIGNSWSHGNVPERGLRVYGAAVIGQFLTGGSTSVCRNSAGTLSSCSSSERYKGDIRSLDSASELLEQLRAVRFDWTDSGQADIGFVAEEVAEILPELVTFNDDGQVEGIEYSRLTAVLAGAMQEYKAGFDQNLMAIRDENQELRELNQDLSERLASIEKAESDRRQLASDNARLIEQNTELEQRLARLEQILLDDRKLAEVSQ